MSLMMGKIAAVAWLLLRLARAPRIPHGPHLLTAISPIDGRYRNRTAHLAIWFSEMASNPLPPDGGTGLFVAV